MKRFKGTKGRWHIGEDYNVYDKNGFDIVEMSHPYRIKENWEELGIKHWGEKKGVSYVDTTEGEVIANAQLIAAAPELLNACIEALKYVSCEEPAHYILTEAIAKAIGKEVKQ